MYTEENKIKVYLKVNNPVRYMASVQGVTLGDCKVSSLETWLKLRHLGAVLKRGKRKGVEDFDNPQSYHYWVENRGKVFDLSGGLTQILDIDTYYNRSARMYMIEEPTVGAFFEDELESFFDESIKKKLRYLSNNINPSTTQFLSNIISMSRREEDEVLYEDLRNHYLKHNSA